MFDTSVETERKELFDLYKKVCENKHRLTFEFVEGNKIWDDDYIKYMGKKNYCTKDPADLKEAFYKVFLEEKHIGIMSFIFEDEIKSHELYSNGYEFKNSLLTNCQITRIQFFKEVI